MMATIRLYEDNAGGLLLWHVEAGRGWSRVEYLDTATFAEDAAIFAADEDGDWTLDPLDDEPQPRPGLVHIATYTDAPVYRHRQYALGRAGALYLRVDKIDE